MHSIPATDITPGMTIRTHFADVFVVSVEQDNDGVTAKGHDLVTGEEVTVEEGVTDRVWLINQITGEPAIPLSVARRAMRSTRESLCHAFGIEGVPTDDYDLTDIGQAIKSVAAEEEITQTV